MKLSEKQALFTDNVAELLFWAEEEGYRITLGEAYRSREEAERLSMIGAGIKNSAHCQRLAIDLNLFKDGVYLTKTSDHAELGKYWKSLHPDNRWGGDFRNRDGNHYSMKHGGIA